MVDTEYSESALIVALEHHVGCGDELFERFGTGTLVEVERDTSLARVVGPPREVGLASRDNLSCRTGCGGTALSDLSSAWRLDDDDIRAGVGEQFSSECTEFVAEFNNPDAVEWARTLEKS